MSRPHAPAVLYSPLALEADLAELVELFVDEIPGRMEYFRHCFDSGDWESLRVAVHQLKGAAGSYGFPELTPVLQRLENAVKTQADAETIGQLLEEAVDWCSRMRAGAAPESLA